MNTKGPTKVEWSAWAAEDPLYGAATWPGHQRGGQQAWTDEAFYDSGRSDCGEFARRWKGYGLNIGNCVELGGGDGRLSKQME